MIRSPSRGGSEVALKSVQVSDSYKGSPNSKDLWARFQVSVHFVGTFFNRTWHWALQYASSALLFLPDWNASAPFQLTSLYRFSEPFAVYIKRSWMFGSANIWRTLSCLALHLENNYECDAMRESSNYRQTYYLEGISYNRCQKDSSLEKTLIGILINRIPKV